MDKLRVGVAALAASGLAVVSLRALRQRGAEDEHDDEPASSEPTTAAEHAAAAAEHVTLAVQTAVESKRAKGAESTESGPAERTRLRRVGKGWIRR